MRVNRDDLAPLLSIKRERIKEKGREPNLYFTRHQECECVCVLQAGNSHRRPAQISARRGVRRREKNEMKKADEREREKRATAQALLNYRARLRFLVRKKQYFIWPTPLPPLR
jgi:hypothetical protein